MRPLEGLATDWPVINRLLDEALSLPVPERGPWRLVRELGEGGMGSVWLAERADGQLKRQVALKRPRLSSPTTCR